ncbi:hypothetical protein R9C00_03950 [Flammeovirgaceae bacterium SG7u.111]|nr:hypothetical protein [Flammeovirgaceae bacterium SG7u.132]WPO36599.1 hypothetical protein R9C00_03950 [Flammeovirgaceae bacterium SG7u.111]
MKKSVKIITGYLGVSMFMFGVLKFVNPFKGWYTTQVAASQLPFPTLSYWAGQFGEIAVGVAFIFLLFQYKKLEASTIGRILAIGNILIIIMMITAIYVHLHPDVPAEVLPLKINPPYIPCFFMALPIISLYLQRK